MCFQGFLVWFWFSLSFINLVVCNFLQFSGNLIWQFWVKTAKAQNFLSAKNSSFTVIKYCLLDQLTHWQMILLFLNTFKSGQAFGIFKSKIPLSSIDSSVFCSGSTSKRHIENVEISANNVTIQCFVTPLHVIYKQAKVKSGRQQWELSLMWGCSEKN